MPRSWIYFGISLQTHSREEIARAVEASAPQLVKLFPELTVTLPHLAPSGRPNPDPEAGETAPLPGPGPDADRLGGNIRPLIVILEDLHWSDSTSLEFLLLLGSPDLHPNRSSCSLTYRSEETTPELTHFLAELDRERLGTEFALKPMSSPDVEEMLQAILDSADPDQQGISRHHFSADRRAILSLSKKSSRLSPPRETFLMPMASGIEKRSTCCTSPAPFRMPCRGARSNWTKERFRL